MEICVSVTFKPAVGAGEIVTTCAEVVEVSVFAFEVVVEEMFGAVVAKKEPSNCHSGYMIEHERRDRSA